ncbi:bifunctional diguanylate cyclase/phosphodiesterase [Noviherbaspirillum humi]|nr:EAL domain-containing protein [Noviherbaspirillum humi]
MGFLSAKTARLSATMGQVPRLAGLWTNLRPSLIWTSLVLLLMLFCWAGLLDVLERERREQEADALKEAEVLARTYAGHLYRSLESIDQITLYIKHGWETSNGTIRLEKVAPEGLYPTDSGLYLSIIDRRGDLVTTTIPFPSKVNIAGQPYFTLHLARDGEFYVGAPQIGPFSRKPIIPFSRRLSDRDGGFSGVVVLSAQPQYFIAGYDKLTLGRHGLLAITNPDGSPRIVRVGDEVYLPENQPFRSNPVFDSRSGSRLLPGIDWFKDGRSRYVAWQVTERYPMMALAGVDQDSFLSPFLKRRQQIVSTAALVSVGVLAILALVIALSLRLARRQQELATIQHTYRIATEAANEGFYIAEPVHDSRGNMTDFKIIDCNHRGADFLRHRRDDLVGKKVSEVYQGETRDFILEVLKRAMINRHYEGEIDLGGLGGEGPRWAQLRILRPESNLAVNMRDISDTKTHVAELQRIGNEDALTGLPNRHWLNGFLPDALKAAVHSRKKFALLYLDLDGFKSVNDSKGHEAGDEVLCHAARRLREAVRPEDRVVRLGGDEFLVILENLAGSRDAAHVADRIQEAFRPPFRITKGVHSVGASIGIAVAPKDGQDSDTLLKHADSAMYAVKKAGKRGYRFFDISVAEEESSREALMREMQHALDYDQFIMYYQPRVDTGNGHTCGLEALVRWVHPVRGLMEPLEFIPLAEETGLIVRLGEQVIKKVISQLAYWSKSGYPLVPVSINVSVRQLEGGSLADTLSVWLRSCRIDPSLVEIEVTEASVARHGADVLQTLAAIQNMGIKLVLDDFGTGYSSLSQLQEMDFDMIKVDHTFAARLEDSEQGTALFNAIITMAHSLDMRVVAEGVETRQQASTLRALGCDEIQGFLVSPPLPPAEHPPTPPVTLPAPA